MLRLLAWLAGCLTPGSTRRIGLWLGGLAWTLRLRRRVAIHNIEQALGLTAPQALKLARRSYGHLGRTAVEFMQVGALSSGRARELLGEGNLSRFREILAQGRGALVLSAHLGNWDLLACAAACCGLPLNVITRDIKSSWLNRFWMAQRARCGVKLLAARGSALAVRAALRRNEVVAVVLDQHEPGGLAVPFFGRRAATASSLARLARATGAPVVPAFLVRDGNQFCMRLLEPVRWVDTGDRALDLLENTCRYSKVIEDQVRACPEQWFWVHRRWKL